MSPILSICVPSIRVERWSGLYQSVCDSIGKNSFEMVFVGPCEVPKEFKKIKNCKFILDYGTPTRCTQIGALHCTGKLFTWVSDDGLYLENTLEKSIVEFSKKTDKDEMAILYGEGDGFHKKPFFGNHPPEYWNAHYHDMKETNVPKHYKIAPLGLLNLKYFKDIGGFDCRYEHINYSTHDLAFRLQNDGGIVHLSPDYVIGFDCPPEQERTDYEPVRDAFYLNDYPLFHKEYRAKYDFSRVKIKFDNWKKSPEKWRRFTN